MFSLSLSLMRSYLSYFFLFCALGCLSSLAAFELSLQSQSAIVINAETGKVLFAKESNKPLYPASTTKILTAWYILETLPFEELQRKICVQKEDIKIIHAAEKFAHLDSYPPYILEHDGINFGLKPGEEISLYDLLHLCLIGSSNDAANVLAKAVGGSIPQFCANVTKFIQEKGLFSTSFVNPHGLYHKEHFTTAQDMVYAAAQAMHNPHFRTIVKMLSFSSDKGTNKREQLFCKQGNRLLKPGKWFYAPSIGIKTGYTSKSQYNLVAAAQKEGRVLIAAVFGAPSADVRYQEVIKLFEKAFQEPLISRTLFSKNSDLFSTSLKNKKKVKACLTEDVTFSYYPSEGGPESSVIDWNIPPLPLRKGEEVGQMLVLGKNQEILARVPIVALEDIEQSPLEKIYSFFQEHKKKTMVSLFLLLVLYFLFHQHKKLDKLGQR